MDGRQEFVVLGRVATDVGPVALAHPGPPREGRTLPRQRDTSRVDGPGPTVGPTVGPEAVEVVTTPVLDPGRPSLTPVHANPPPFPFVGHGRRTPVETGGMTMVETGGRTVEDLDPIS